MNRIIRYISTVKSRPSAGLRAAGSIMAVCVAGFVALTLWGCQRKELQVQEYMVVVSIIDGSSTKSIPQDSDPQINDIAIFAFSESENELVGYIYESDLAGSGKTIFPMTLTKGGIIDFYVVANSEPGFFEVVDSDDKEVDWTRTSTVDPPEGVTPDYLKACKVKLRDRNAAGFWYVPMTNLPGSSGENMTFDVDGMTRIPIELTRAVSKVEVWFRTLGDMVPEDQTTKTDWITNRNPSSDDYYPTTSSFSLYYSIDDLSLTIPVESVGIYEEEVVYHTAEGNMWEENELGPFNYINSNGGDMFPPYEKDQIPQNFYSDEYFVHIWTCYIFPNTFGGNMAGEAPDQVDKSTLLSVEYSQWQQEGEYKVTTEQDPDSPRWVDGWFGVHWEYKYNFHWKWESTGIPTQQPQTQKVKQIYLPPIERNTSVRVWCPLGDDTDRSFTYTVVDWDETVTVNVPDFN